MKQQILITLLYLFFMVGLLRSNEVEYDNALSHRQQKVPLPPSTTSVKCHCKTQAEHEDSNSHAAEPTQEDIEIQIFKSEKDKKRSEVQNAERRRDDNPLGDEDSMQSSVHKAIGQDRFKIFKSFKNADLSGEEKDPTHSSGNVMLLGVISDSFKGPRRKRRDVNRNVVYVYPDNRFQQHSVGNKGTVETQDPLSMSTPTDSETTNVVYPSNQIISRRNSIVDDHSLDHESDLKQRDIQLNKAMEQAWEQYGPKSPMMRKAISPPDQIHSPSNIAEIIQNSFQPQGSEWDDKMTEIPVPVLHRDIPQPGFFSSLLTRYIDFEVNNHELADFGRKVGFGILVGVLIAGWIVLGMFFGIIPLHWLIFKGKRSATGSNGKRDTGDELSDITDRILLSLDSGWLKNLEERVRKDPRGNFVRTHAHCCILPDSQTNGLANCQLVRKSRASNTFKCLSDLIYNFEFAENSKSKNSSSNSIFENIQEFR